MDTAQSFGDFRKATPECIDIFGHYWRRKSLEILFQGAHVGVLENKVKCIRLLITAIESNNIRVRPAIPGELFKCANLIFIVGSCIPSLVIGFEHIHMSR